MTTIDQVAKLRNKVDKLKAQSERARGAAEALRDTLKKDWHCKSLSEARDLLSSKKEAAEKLEQDFSDAYDAFQEKWEDELIAV